MLGYHNHSSSIIFGPHNSDTNQDFNLIATPMGSFGGGWPHRIKGTYLHIWF